MLLHWRTFLLVSLSARPRVQYPTPTVSQFISKTSELWWAPSFCAHIGDSFNLIIFSDQSRLSSQFDKQQPEVASHCLSHANTSHQPSPPLLQDNPRTGPAPENRFAWSARLFSHRHSRRHATPEENVYLQGCKHTLCLGGICLGSWETWRALLLVPSPTFHIDLQASLQSCFSLKHPQQKKTER